MARTVTINTTVEIDVAEVLEDASTADILAELKSRDETSCDFDNLSEDLCEAFVKRDRALFERCLSRMFPGANLDIACRLRQSALSLGAVGGAS